MAGKMAGLETIRGAVDGMRFHSVEVRRLAVLAELEEQAKDRRDASQDEIAHRYGASGRMLREWVKWYKEYGLEGLEDLGGQGAKPRVPRELLWKIIDECLEEEAEPPDGDGDGDGDSGGPCEACELAKEGKKPSRDPPEPCPCNGRCVTKGKRGGGCECKAGKVCACRCCRPIYLPAKGPRHSPDCPHRRVSPHNGTSVKRVAYAIKKKTGVMYSLPQVRRIMKERALSRRKITRRLANRVPRDKAKRWQGRFKISLERYVKKGFEVFVHDEAHVAEGKKDGDAWGPRGERTTLPSSGSGRRLTLHGSISLKSEVVIGEYVRGDSATFLDHLEQLLKHREMVLVVTDNLSAHTSRDTKKGIRKLLRKYPGKKLLVRTLPVGHPELSIVEALWNKLKAALLARFHYPDFNELRWSIQDFAEDNRTISLSARKYLFRKDVL